MLSVLGIGPTSRKRADIHICADLLARQMDCRVNESVFTKLIQHENNKLPSHQASLIMSLLEGHLHSEAVMDNLHHLQIECREDKVGL